MLWKDIKGFEGYQVSDTGLVRTHDMVTINGRHMPNKILKPKKSTAGGQRPQERVALYRNGEAHDLLIARLVAFTFYDADITNHELTVNHKDGNWRNNNLENLELMSHAENIKRGFENGQFAAICNRTELTNKRTGETKIYRSQKQACEAMERSATYIHTCMRTGRTENKDFSWKVLEKGRRNDTQVRN